MLDEGNRNQCGLKRKESLDESWNKFSVVSRCLRQSLVSFLLFQVID